ncbi:MAG TPA: hypothetical protein PLE28_02980 [bacterium]|nr:hypothetical protein [bacterium]
MPLKTSPINPKKNKKTIKKIKIDNEEKNDSNELDNFVEIKEKIRDELMKNSGEFSPNENFDSKKEFFRLMAEKIKDDSSDLPESHYMEDKKYSFGPNSRVSHYRKMVLRFSFLTVVLLLIVAYFSLVKLDVIAYTNKETLEDSLNFYAYKNDGQVNLDRSVKATMSQMDIETSDTFSSTGVKSSGGEITGKVKIINQSSKNQPLVATTRLLSSDNKLFRIKNTVNVPAGGSIEVDIYTDEVSENMALEPGKFTIPGLWEGLQDKIYAENSVKFEYKANGKKYITQEDIDKAIIALNEKMIKEAENKINQTDSSKKNIFSLNSSSSTMEVQPELGTEVDSFEVKIKNNVNVITVNSSDVVNIIKQKLSLLDFDEESSEIDADKLNYTLLSYNPTKSLAEIKVDFSAKTALGEGEKIINTKHLVNLNEKQIKTYLDGISNIKSYELNFKPGFIKRSSILVDRINVVYK